jgi:hypothetical protein
VRIRAVILRTGGELANVAYAKRDVARQRKVYACLDGGRITPINQLTW